MVYTALIIGNSGTGKTSLLGGIANEPFPQLVEQLATNVKKSYPLEGNKTLYLHDAAIDCNGEIWRPYFSSCDLSIVVFSIDDPDSLLRVETWWMVQIRRRVPNKPVILIGTKLDLRSDPETIARLALTGNRPVSYEDGCNVATRIGACMYIECSAKHNINIQLVKQNILETLEKYDADKHKEEIEDEDTCVCRVS